MKSAVTELFALADQLGVGTIAAADGATARRVRGREAVRVGNRALTHRELDDQAMSPRTPDALLDVLGQRPLERYGLTETGYVLSNPYDERIAGTARIAVPGAEVRVVNNRGEHCDDGSEGEIVVRGPQVSCALYSLPPSKDDITNTKNGSRRLRKVRQCRIQ